MASKTLINLPYGIYRERSRYAYLYEQITSVPEGLRWKPSSGPHDKHIIVLLSTPGGYYKIIRDLKTGDVVYFKMKDVKPDAAPAEKIDTEPTRDHQVRYRVGKLAWFVDTGNRWYLVEVVARKSALEYGVGGNRIAIKSSTGWDADRRCEWPYGDLLEFPAYKDNQLFTRLRPLADRYR